MFPSPITPSAAGSSPDLTAVRALAVALDAHANRLERVVAALHAEHATTGWSSPAATAMGLVLTATLEGFARNARQARDDAEATRRIVLAVQRDAEAALARSAALALPGIA